MKDLLIYILQNITTDPDNVQVEEKDEEGVKHFVITTSPNDIGRVIGREGKIIKAIRSIMRVVAIQNNERVRVSVVSETEKPSENEETVTPETQEKALPEQTETPQEIPQETPQADPDSEPVPQDQAIDLDL